MQRLRESRLTITWDENNDLVAYEEIWTRSVEKSKPPQEKALPGCRMAKHKPFSPITAY